MTPVETTIRRRGFSLIELAVVIALTGSSLVATLGLFEAHQRLQEDLEASTLAHRLLSRELELVRLLPYEEVDKLDFTPLVDYPAYEIGYDVHEDGNIKFVTLLIRWTNRDGDPRLEWVFTLRGTRGA